MLVSWSLPTLDFSLWPCVVLLGVFIPVSIWHDRNWRRTLSEYAEVRRSAGAQDPDWPSADVRRIMGVQPGLVFAACGLLAVAIAVGVSAALLWPRTPPGFEGPINPLDLPYLWTVIVAATAALVAGVAIGIDAARNPYAKVARFVRRAIYAPAEQRAQLFARALEADPGVPHASDAADASTPPSSPPSGPTPTLDS